MWLNPQFPADLITFTEEILNGKLHFLCSVTFITVLPFSFAMILLCSCLSSKKSSVKNHNFQNIPSAEKLAAFFLTLKYFSSLFINVPFKKVPLKFKQIPWKVPVKEFSKLFIFEIYVQLFSKNMLLQILLSNLS